MAAELEKIICSGSSEVYKQTYALFEERVPKESEISRDEAVSRLCSRYFRSHGAATLPDFVWWSGLTLADARKGIESCGNNMVKLDFEGQEYYCLKDVLDSSVLPDQTNLLPAFDEFLISYKDRTATIAKEDQPKAFSLNGIFYPTITYEGQTVGVWKRQVKKKQVSIETEMFPHFKKDIQAGIAAESERFGRFLGLEVFLK
jgi:hypothetical protein